MPDGNPVLPGASGMEHPFRRVLSRYGPRRREWSNEQDDYERKKNYSRDITYATNSELGFDYLRDNMKFSKEEMVQRGHFFTIVDEIDSCLIDEARTPLVISGSAEDSSVLYKSINKLIPLLKGNDYELDEKQRTCNLTDQGINNIENALISEKIMEDGSLFDVKNVSLMHHINQALRAHKLFKKNTHYMVKNNNVIIIDEFTGRAMEGRRFGEGQHQAIEAKENVNVQPESQTLASVTFQNYFRMYPKLSGMTGTALTEEGEFSEIYNLSVIEIPTNLKVARIDNNDEIYKTNEERDEAVIKLIENCQKNNQPVLVGTVSIEKSEILSKLLNAKNIKHEVLNAKFHEQEAQIIGYAGVPAAVTIATNMAGRGTDIQLGGNLEIRKNNEIGDYNHNDKSFDKLKTDIEEKKRVALDAGGLFVIGTERHESRRIDNQLRGRTGRQGDPGGSKFLLSLQDDLMRIFGSERLENMLGKLGLEKGEAIVHPWINKAVEKAQSKVEAHNFEIRKQLLKFDDVMNDQRKVIFDQRKEIMKSNDISEMIRDMRHQVIETIVYNLTTSRQQAMILVQSCFNTSKGRSHIRASMVFHCHRACFITDNHMIFKKGTSILCYRLNWPARCRPCRAINCVSQQHLSSSMLADVLYTFKYKTISHWIFYKLSSILVHLRLSTMLFVLQPSTCVILLQDLLLPGFVLGGSRNAKATSL